MNERIFYLPVRISSHNGGSGCNSYFAVQPLQKRDWTVAGPLFLSPDQMSLLYIHPSQLLTAPGQGAATLEEEIIARHNAHSAEEFSRKPSHD